MTWIGNNSCLGPCEIYFTTKFCVSLCLLCSLHYIVLYSRVCRGEWIWSKLTKLVNLLSLEKVLTFLIPSFTLDVWLQCQYTGQQL
jgi:hypothetical protein